MISLRGKLEKTIIIISVAILFFGLFEFRPSSFNQNKKTIYIHFEALRWDFVYKNLNSLPHFKWVIENGVYGEMQPIAPTFTNAEFPAILGSKYAGNTQWMYIYIFNTSQKEWNCSTAFEGPLGAPSTPIEIWYLQDAIGNRVEHYYFSVLDPELDVKKLNSSIDNSDFFLFQTDSSDSHPLNVTVSLPDSKLIEIDRELGLIIDHLNRTGWLNQTNIIMYGDHGMWTASKRPLWTPILSDLEKLGINENNTCYWNDGGVSVRFWFRNQSFAETLGPKIADYFRTKADQSCFFVPNESYLESKKIVSPDRNVRRANLGDLFIGVNVDCKLTYGQIPNFLDKFKEQLTHVDSYLSMHGYISNDDNRLMSFFAAVGPAFKKNYNLTIINAVDISPTYLFGINYCNPNYYNNIDGIVRMDILSQQSQHCDKSILLQN